VSEHLTAMIDHTIAGMSANCGTTNWAHAGNARLAAAARGVDPREPRRIGAAEARGFGMV
jgi:hypothetical protein